MRLLIAAALFPVFLSCAISGSGIRTVTGEVEVPGTPDIKIGVFEPGDQYVFLHDDLNDADKDVVFKNIRGDEKDGIGGVNLFTPYQAVSMNGDKSYSIELPSDPSLIKCMIAWDDTDSDGIFDLGDEQAYLPVKEMNGTKYVIHFFSYLDIVKVVTYLAVYSTMDRTAAYYDMNFYDPRQDDFDAIGADGYNFYFD